jgi:hypothetical protein
LPMNQKYTTMNIRFSFVLLMWGISFLQLSGQDPLAYSIQFKLAQTGYAESMAIGMDGAQYLLGVEEVASGVEQLVLIKTASDGTLTWGRRIGENDGLIRPNRVVVMNNGDVMVIGEMFSESFGGADAWLARFNSAGTLLWQRHYGTFEYEIISDLKELSDGRLVVSGVSYQSGGFRDALVAILSSEGIPQDYVTFQGGDYDYANTIVVDAAGSIFVAGRTNSMPGGQAQFWIARLNTSLEVAWQVAFGATNGLFSDLNALAVLPNGNLLAGGRSGSNAAGLVVDPSGNLVGAYDWGYGEVGDIEMDGTGRPCLLSGGGTLHQLDPTSIEVESSFILDPIGGVNSIDAMELDVNGQMTFLGYLNTPDSSQLVLAKAYAAVNDDCAAYSFPAPSTLTLEGTLSEANLPLGDPVWQSEVAGLPIAVFNPDRLVACEESCLGPLADFGYDVDSFTVAFQGDLSLDADTFYWDFGADTSQATNPVYTFPGPGTYEVCLTVTNECGEDVHCQEILLDLINSQEVLENAARIAVFPNPAIDQVTVTNVNNVVHWRVYDARGHIWQMGNVKGVASFEIPLMGMPMGMYYLQCLEQDGTSTVIPVTKQGS